MSGSIQSSDYVPGMSGLKIDLKSGEFELSSARLQVGTLPSDPQPITITACEWSDYDLPANAIERYAFIGAELAKIPSECRDSAEFKTDDFSFDRDGSDYRTTLTYVRQETQEEAKARHEKAKAAGTRISIKDGLMTVTHDGVVRIKLDIPAQAEPEQAEPFKVDGDQVFINEAFVEDGSVRKAKIGAGFYAPIPGVYVDADGRVCVKRDDVASDEGLDSKLTANWSVNTQALANGQYYVAGVGLGLPSQFLLGADKFRVSCMCDGGYTGDAPKPGDALKASGVSAMLDQRASKIGETSLGQELKERIDDIGMGQVNKRLDELKEKQGAENRAVAERIDSLATKICELHALIAKRT